MEIQESSLKSLYFLLLSFSTFFCLIGYIIYFYVITKRKHLRRKYVWMTSLALADIFFALNLLPILISLVKDKWVFGIYGGLVNSILSLSAGFVGIAGAQGVAIHRHELEQGKDAQTSQKFRIGMAWVTGIAMGVVPSLGIGHYEEATESSFGCLLDMSKSDLSSFIYMLGSFGFFAVFPLWKIVTSYYKLIKMNKANWSILIIPVVFVLCYAPFSVHALVAVTIPTHVPSELEVVIVHVSSWF
ncbi:uncharacterized protein LOC100182476 [Ciona intestinalis]